MPDIIELIQKWWKQMLAAVLVSILVIGVIVFMKPKLYLSVATAIPASSFSSDRSAVFNENIQALYSTLGTPDDLDRVIGTASLDTVYINVAQQFNLSDHYKISEKDNARLKSALQLKKKTNVHKSEHGELKVKVWDIDRNLAAQLANAILKQLQDIHQHLNSISNRQTLEALKAGRKKLLMPDSSSGQVSGANEMKIQYEKLIAEYQLMVDSKPPALIIVETARPAVWADKPRKKQILLATAFLSLVFSFFVILLIERHKKPAT